MWCVWLVFSSGQCLGKLSLLVLLVAKVTLALRSKNGAHNAPATFLQRAAQGEDPHTFLTLDRANWKNKKRKRIKTETKKEKKKREKKNERKKEKKKRTPLLPPPKKKKFQKVTKINKKKTKKKRQTENTKNTVKNKFIKKIRKEKTFKKFKKLKKFFQKIWETAPVFYSRCFLFFRSVLFSLFIFLFFSLKDKINMRDAFTQKVAVTGGPKKRFQ